MTVNVSGDPLSVSYAIYSDITISPGGVATVVIDSGDLPFDWLDDITPETRPMFILTSAEMASRSVTIDGTPMAMVAGKETDLSPYYGANYLISYDVPNGESGFVVWSAATGIALRLHVEYVDGGDVFTIDVEYQSSDVDIYADQDALEQLGNKLVLFFTSTAGIVVLVVIIAALVAIALVSAARKGGKKGGKKGGRKH
jgi:hypothetical protein